MRKKAFTLEQADRVIGVLKQFTAEVAKAASDAIKELAEAKADSGHKHTVSDISGLTVEAIGAAAASHTHVSTGSTSIPTSGWKTDSNTKFPYYYDLSISGIAASDRVDLNVAIASVDIATTCGLCPLTEAFAGKVRLRAKKAPTAAISAEYWIMKK